MKQKTKFKRNRIPNGVVFFLGNIHSHYIHAMPLFKKTGGEFVVLSRESYDYLERKGLPVRLVDDRPDLYLEFDPTEVQSTIDYLNHYAKIVIFYEVFSISLKLKAKQMMLTHGNSFKDYYIAWRREIIGNYDYMASLGPDWRNRVLKAGYPEDRLIDVGLARWDEIIHPHDAKKRRKTTLRALDFDEEKPIVTYFPTWWGPSSVYEVGRHILRYITDDYNLIFRPHPDTPKEIINQYLHIMSHKSSQRYVPEGAYGVGLMEIYNSSDVFVGDMSSVTLDAILTYKPMMFAFDDGEHRQDSGVYAPIKEIFEYSHKIDKANVSQIEKFIADALTKGAPKELWDASAKRVFYGLEGDTVKQLAMFIKQVTT